MRDRPANAARFSAVAVVIAACVALVFPTAAVARTDPVAPRPQAYRVAGFGLDPLGDAGPRTYTFVAPEHPDSYFGWYRSVVRVTLMAQRPGTVRYSWNRTADDWIVYGGPLVVPEGRNTLYAQASDRDGHDGPIVALELKVNYRSPAADDAASLEALMPFSVPTTRTASVKVSVVILPWAGPHVRRVFGPDRYGTSQQIAFVGWRNTQTVIIARGDKFPDALASGGLAGVYDAPILLVRPTSLPDTTTAEIRRLGAGNAIIVGGVKAVSAGVESSLRGLGLGVERIGGEDRYETAALIARAVVARGGQRGAAFIARGDLYPDSLAVSPFAFRARRPVLLVKPTSLPEVTRAALRDLAISDVVIAGSDRAVSAGVEGAIVAASGTRVTRAQGEDRYGTAVEAARWGVSNGLGGWAFVGIGTGQNFPDALCGGPAAGKAGGVILMTPKGSLHQLTAAELRSHGDALREVQVYGSDRAVSAAVWDAILDAVR